MKVGVTILAMMETVRPAKAVKAPITGSTIRAKYWKRK